LEEYRVARVRTDEKRRQIIDVASQLFQELGYDRTSMSLISERLGGSKATLYGYFKSKEELLQSVLVYDVTTEADRLMNQFLSGENLREGLITLGQAYMHRRLSSGPIANVRIVATQPANSTIGKEFYENVLRPAWERLANRFQILMEAGILIRADSWIAAMQWKGMCEWDMFERRLLGAIKEADPDEIRRASIAAADAFLKLYGADPEKAKKAKPTMAPRPRKKKAA
jgi:AcrR family transcriptional regulator